MGYELLLKGETTTCCELKITDSLQWCCSFLHTVLVDYAFGLVLFRVTNAHGQYRSRVSWRWHIGIYTHELLGNWLWCR